MKTIGAIGIGVAAAVITTAIVDAVHTAEVKERAFSYAKSLAGKKGIINLGAGPQMIKEGRTLQAQIVAESPAVVVNLDIVPDGMPNFIQWDIEEGLPFGDKTFGVAFASHVLEHLDDFEFALSEAARVADHVVVVLPHPLSPAGWLVPAHKQHFSREDIAKIETDFPNVKILF
jgi:SAM-dependent methyltransferase